MKSGSFVFIHKRFYVPVRVMEAVESGAARRGQQSNVLFNVTIIQAT
jgi:hypothetical protein